MATSRKKSTGKKKAAVKPKLNGASSSVPQLSPAQKLVLRKQYEEMRESKVRVANLALKIDQAKAQLAELKREAVDKDDQFAETCKSALRGAGIDLEDTTRAYSLDVTDMSVKEVPAQPRPAGG